MLTRMKIALIALLSTLPLAAQTVSAAAGATSFHYQGASYAGSETQQYINLINFGTNKASIVTVGSAQTMVPGASLSLYQADVGYQPDLSSLLSKTNLSASSLTFRVDVLGGVAATATGNKGTIGAQGTVNYAMTPNVAATGGFVTGGLIGTAPYWQVSAGITAIFGQSNNPSTLVQKQIRKANAAKAARAVTQ